MNPEAVKQKLKAPRQVKDSPVTEDSLLSTGSTLLNLALSGSRKGGFPAGRYVYFVGDSQSGKTWFSLTCLAEAQLHPKFKRYRIVYDNVEDGAQMDLGRYFGRQVAERVEPPSRDKHGEAIHSSTIEEMYFGLDDALEQSRKTKTPFVWIVDSMDGLSSKYEGSKFDEKKKASRTGKKAKGDYGDGKAKINSSYLRRVRAGLRDTGSILIIISQTRDNIDAGLFENPKTRSGGHALDFYSDVQIWTSVAGQIKKTIKGKQRQVGSRVRLRVTKNRLTGKTWTVTVPFYWSHGIDDIGSCVEFLADEHWPKNKDSGKIDGTGDFQDCRGTVEQVVRFVEKNGLEEDVRELVEEVWKEIESACSVKRKRRYE